MGLARDRQTVDDLKEYETVLAKANLQCIYPDIAHDTVLSYAFCPSMDNIGRLIAYSSWLNYSYLYCHGMDSHSHTQYLR